MSSASQISLPSPKPFPWDSNEPTIRLVTSTPAAAEEDEHYRPALDLFANLNGRFSYGLTASEFESLDSILIPSVNNHADDERSSGDDRSVDLDRRGSGVTSDNESSVALCGHRIDDAVAPKLVDAPVLMSSLGNQRFRSKSNAPAKRPTTARQGSVASVRAMSVLEFLNSHPCPLKPSLTRSASGETNTTELTEQSGSTPTDVNLSVTADTSVDENQAPVATSSPVKFSEVYDVIDCPPAMEFGSWADWTRNPRWDVHEYQEKIRCQELEKKQKSFFYRARNLVKRFMYHWRN